MTASGILKKINSGQADNLIAGLYGEPTVAFQKKRFAELLRRLDAQFPESDAMLVRAPGRTELGGNHTDHNHGRVLAAAVSLDILAAAVITDDRRVTLEAAGNKRPIVVDLADLKKRKAEEHTTAALVRGVARALADRGFAAGGFHTELDATLPQGAGLSSSAAIEVLIGLLFSELYNGGRLSPLELALAGRRAENDYYGKPCGLMDQLASAVGGVTAFDFKNPERPRIETVGLDPERAGYALIVVATGGTHADLTAAYAAIPAEMKAVATALGGKTLRDIAPGRLLARLPRAREKAGDRAVLRALHFFDENERVKRQIAVLKRRDLTGFLDLVNESGRSSWEYLQNCLVPDNHSRQSVALGLALTRRFLETHNLSGASRVHGGGFAGTVQCWIPLAAAGKYRACLESVFGKGSVIPIRLCPRGALRLF